MFYFCCGVVYMIPIVTFSVTWHDITDYVCGGELFTHLHHIGPFTEPHARVYAAEITLALEHLHHVQSHTHTHTGNQEH